MTTDPTGSTQDPAPPPGRPRQQRDPRDLGALRRSTTDRHVAGVAGGLSRHLDIDPIIIRVALVVLIFFGGAGLIIYAAIWLLVPQDDEDSAMIALDPRSRAFLLYVMGAVAALAVLGDTIGHVHVPWGLLVVALIVVAVLGSRDRLGWRSRRRRRQDPLWSSDDTPAGTASGVAPEPGAGTSYGSGYGADYGAQVETRVRQRVDEHVQAVTARYASYPPANPRRRGPILFWFTLALIALAEGVLGIVDAAGVHVAPPAYAALAVGIIGVMLVLGAFWGRAGGLILIGLIASVVLAGSLAADKWDLDSRSRSVTYAPTSAAQVRAEYRMGTGELHLDLSRVSDPAALGGHAITVSGHVGRIEIIVPPQVTVSAEGAVRGPGQVDIFGEGHGGIHSRSSGDLAGTLTGQPLFIRADLNVGKITVETSDE